VTNVLGVLIAVILCLAGYFGYWLAWCWVWTHAWPAGPQWFTSPPVYVFLAFTITIVIMTIALVGGAK
jgi:hypothetical protein